MPPISLMSLIRTSFVNEIYYTYRLHLIFQLKRTSYHSKIENRDATSRLQEKSRKLGSCKFRGMLVRGIWHPNHQQVSQVFQIFPNIHTSLFSIQLMHGGTFQMKMTISGKEDLYGKPPRMVFVWK